MYLVESDRSSSHIQRVTIKQPVPQAGVLALPRGGQGRVLAKDARSGCWGAGRPDVTPSSGPHLAPSCSLPDPHTRDSGEVPKSSLLAATCLALSDGLGPALRGPLGELEAPHSVLERKVQ